MAIGVRLVLLQQRASLFGKFHKHGRATVFHPRMEPARVNRQPEADASLREQVYPGARLASSFTRNLALYVAILIAANFSTFRTSLSFLTSSRTPRPSAYFFALSMTFNTDTGKSSSWAAFT